MPRKHPIRVFYANQPLESKQVSFLPEDQVRESHFVRGDTIHGTVLADKYQTIGAEKFPKECQGGLTRDEHSPNAKLWQPRKAFKLESI